MSEYLDELRAKWRPLLAAVIGMGSGFSITSYVTSIMAPHMLKELGWSKSEFAAVGSLGLISTLAFPFVGRLADVTGVRKTAAIGVASFPLVYGALALQSGDIRFYIGLFILMSVVSITTTSTVYSRMVVQHVERARGLALAIAASGPALAGAMLAPLLNDFVEAHGWRAGYWAMAVFGGGLGTFALLLMPAHVGPGETRASGRRPAREDYSEIFRKPAFWILAGAMLLCNMPQVLALTQLNLALLENGVSPGAISGMISGFAVGTLTGRFVCGLALDRFPPHIVAALGMALSACGLFLLASSIDTAGAVFLAILLIGLSFGAEADLLSFLVVGAFGVRVYSSVMGLMTGIISIAASAGAIVLSITLKDGGTFVPFLTLAGGLVLIGSVLLLFVPRNAPGVMEARRNP